MLNKCIFANLKTVYESLKLLSKFILFIVYYFNALTCQCFELPDLELILKHDNSDVEFEESEMHVTTFRAKDKFERINDDTTLDTDTDNE